RKGGFVRRAEPPRAHASTAQSAERRASAGGRGRRRSDLGADRLAQAITSDQEHGEPREHRREAGAGLGRGVARVPDPERRLEALGAQPRRHPAIRRGPPRGPPPRPAPPPPPLPPPSSLHPPAASSAL